MNYQNQKTIFKFLKRIIPHSWLFAGMNFVVKRKYNIQIGRGSRIYLDSSFGGHNTIMNNTQIHGSDIGLGTYIANNTIIGSAKIGKFCSIGDNVRIMLGRHPAKTFVSTHPVFYSPKKIIDFTFAKEQGFEEHLYLEPEKKYVVEIGNDVWIANNAVIADGIKIGDGAIIATGAVVTKDVEPYTIVGGLPAQVIRKRFEDKQIVFLQKFKWWDKNLAWIKENYKDFSNIDTFISKNS